MAREPKVQEKKWAYVKCKNEEAAIVEGGGADI